MNVEIYSLKCLYKYENGKNFEKSNGMKETLKYPKPRLFRQTLEH